ncbi:MlaD family protein [Cyanobacterium aponinum UTEX 3222]|uniref:Mammalian cell entry related domain protein n=1 Tax=Cyanobacterium aponinum (strain PCC 10605) TaxID=755178 RepID=K9Z8P8_CYAAP|nr:MlaD family protein [Cyanobacterium aponinum]AFZ54970.1 Mammalian cell entry related domain protein [Cyanobacterium aponinum PCC 10605]PHV63114.1 MCE family protein [Cyanobacterium aponinum IPPAS B-1201]WRL40153.1 MlaD family protein [Cyanobacterium aponinum UTEX 3221]WRL43047.1 MlaD family protein [Cyanobacterium aponinum UTEX 3222]
MIRSRLMREGSVGLFLLLGLLVFGGIVFFLKKDQLRGSNYQIKLMFENAGGLREGARVFFRGVAVGRVASIQPTSNGVEVWTEINNKLPIPRDVIVSTTRSGLLGEVSVNIIPQGVLSNVGEDINPLGKECEQKQLILCNNEKIPAQASPDLIESLARLADSFDDETFFENLNTAVDNTNKATEQFIVLTQEVTGVTNRVQKEMDTISNTFTSIGRTADSLSNTANTLSNTANTATTQIEKLGSEYTNTAIQINLLASNLNQIIADNKTDFQNAIASLSQTATDISQVAQTTNNLVAKIDEKDVQKITQNLGTTSENLAQISSDLKTIADELNNPTNLATLQQTLDSARVTFANTAKITSDIDQFTGDPQFRRNLKNLVDGLSNLVSYTDLLEKQVELAILLEELDKETAKSSKDKWGITSQKLPNTIETITK